VKGRAWIIAALVAAGLAIAFALFEWHSQQISSAPHLCRIGTFNLHELSASEIGKAEKIAKLIKTHNLQVVTLQEVGDEQGLKVLTKYLRSYNYIISPQTNSHRLAVLFQRGKIKLTYKDTIPLSEEHPGQRDALVAYGKVLSGGFDFILVDVHLASRDKQWRDWQLIQLHKWVYKELNTEKERDIILAGDFNDPLLLDRDAFNKLDSGMGLYIATQDSQKLDSTFCDKTYKSPVDFIIITPDCRAEYIDDTATFYDYMNKGEMDSTSDHRLAWATFSSDDLDDLTPNPLDISPLAITIKMPNTVQRGSKITVQAHTFPNATCFIHVLYPSGEPPKSKLQPQKANEKGFVNWEWKISGNANPGLATVQIEARWNWAHALVTKSFKITAAKTSMASFNRDLL